ncbi:hypothetical protein BTZ20_1065 [Rhodococcus sp. MTM3W5.2]|nr:hypothetical protein BTZ20_1065 [Rhodococcus sp. MTM3W5.2]
MLREPLDRAALARRVPTLEHDHVPAAGRLGPVLQFEQLDLQQPLGHLVLGALHPILVRVPSRQVSTARPSAALTRIGSSSSSSRTVNAEVSARSTGWSNSVIRGR